MLNKFWVWSLYLVFFLVGLWIYRHPLVSMWHWIWKRIKINLDLSMEVWNKCWRLELLELQFLENNVIQNKDVCLLKAIRFGNTFFSTRFTLMAYSHWMTQRWFRFRMVLRYCILSKQLQMKGLVWNNTIVLLVRTERIHFYFLWFDILLQRS